MKDILFCAEMQQCDKNTMEYFGVPSAVLMERAACVAVDEILTRMPEGSMKVLIACGSGNNGGDGFAMARLLYLQGHQVDILFWGKLEKMSVEGARQLGIVQKYGIPVVSEIPEKTYDLVVDAIFGIGLSRNVGGAYAEQIRKLNELSGYKVAVDICSGINGDNGQVMGIAFRADLTVTFGFGKLGQYLYPGAEYAGTVVVRDMGIDEKSLLDYKPVIHRLEDSDSKLLPRRKDDSHKGTYGRLLVIAGSRNMSGAAILSARAAYCTGTGLVKVLTPECNRLIVQTSLPEAILTVYEEDTDLCALVEEQLQWADACVLGPGLGTGDQARELVRLVTAQANIPCIIDADGINILAEEMEILPPQTILTPHLKEMSRLTGSSIPEIKADMIGAARDTAQKLSAVVVLKDAHTIVAFPDGVVYINTSGNHGMATAGSGDVLSGILGGLVSQHTEWAVAAPLGVYLHGRAGDKAAEQVGRAGLMASDLCQGIRQCMKALDR